MLLIFQGRLGSFSLCWFSDELLTSYYPTVTSYEILLWNLHMCNSFWVLHLCWLPSSRRAFLYYRNFKSLIFKFQCLCPWNAFQVKFAKFADCKKSSSSSLLHHLFHFMRGNFRTSLKVLLSSVCVIITNLT
jgi:hypothetical protein